jgi:hypothetical protein
VFVDWNDLKPMQNVSAKGSGGPNDYSNWTYTYNETYHNITAGINELTSKITCYDNPSNITSKYYSVNVTGHQKYDLILLHLGMREFDGRDVINSLKEDGILESRHIIFTASSDRTLIGEMDVRQHCDNQYVRSNKIKLQIDCHCTSKETTPIHFFVVRF